LNKVKVAIVLGLICIVLSYAITQQVKTIYVATQGMGSIPAVADNDLKDQVLQWKTRYEEAFASLEKANLYLDKIRSEAVQDLEGSTEKENEIKRVNMLLGLTDVEGEGVVISLKDNDSVTAESISVTDDISYYLVHDMDLRSLVNDLENSGAEAISINGERIISSTSITCEGTIININGNKVGSPFTIKAIGPAIKMYGALTRPGGYVEGLNSTGINTTVKQSPKVQIGKYSGAISAKVMEYID
jgi:uncharacterized protein YlxW (UPF0749 family)